MFGLRLPWVDPMDPTACRFWGHPMSPRSDAIAWTVRRSPADPVSLHAPPRTAPRAPDPPSLVRPQQHELTTHVRRNTRCPAPVVCARSVLGAHPPPDTPRPHQGRWGGTR